MADSERIREERRILNDLGDDEINAVAPPMPEQDGVQGESPEQEPDGMEPQEVDVGGRKVMVQEMGMGGGSPRGEGNEMQQTNNLLERLIMLVERLPSEIGDELKGG